MNIAIVSAENPRRMEWDDTSITLDVLFSHLPEKIPFTARMDDLEEHGRVLYVRAIGGEFGEIAIVHLPKPSDAEQRARVTERLNKVTQVISPLEDAEKLGIASEAELAALNAWRLYRVALYRLPQSEGWPENVTWPEQPN